MELAKPAMLKIYNGLRHLLALPTSNFNHVLLLLLMTGFFVSCRPFQSEQLDAVRGPTVGANVATTTPAFHELTPAVSATSETEHQRTIAPEPTFSELTVNSSKPDAAVLVNGLQVGETPYQGTWPTGMYTVTVKLPGFQPWQSIVHLQATKPVTLTAEFSLEPLLEQVLDVCVKEYWWAEDGRSVYYVGCKQGGTIYSDKINGEWPVWRLDLASGEVSEAEDAWSPTWVPRAFTALVPESVPPWLISVAPSARRVIFLELIEDPSVPTPTPPSDPRELGPVYIEPYHRVYAILDDATVVELGTIYGYPRDFSWSEDEERLFISAEPYAAHKDSGWLVDWQALTLTPMTPPPYGDLQHPEFHNASLLPNGEAIWYRPDVTEPLRIWNFESGEQRELGKNIGLLGWLEDSRYLLYADVEEFYWYDLGTDSRVQVISGESLPRLRSWQLSPQGDKLLVSQFTSLGAVASGLWLLVLDTK